MPQIKNGKVRIHKVEITVNNVLSWMEKQGHGVTAVQMRDQFNWPLRETARRLMRMLAEENKVVIRPNPKRKRAYIYSLPKLPKSETEDLKSKSTKV